MQLAQGLGTACAERADGGRILSPFQRTLLALCVIAAPALGGVLPRGYKPGDENEYLDSIRSLIRE